MRNASSFDLYHRIKETNNEIGIGGVLCDYGSCSISEDKKWFIATISNIGGSIDIQFIESKIREKIGYEIDIRLQTDFRTKCIQIFAELPVRQIRSPIKSPIRSGRNYFSILLIIFLISFAIFWYQIPWSVKVDYIVRLLYP